jgi:hypothetical protein
MRAHRTHGTKIFFGYTENKPARRVYLDKEDWQGEHNDR